MKYVRCAVVILGLSSSFSWAQDRWSIPAKVGIPLAEVTVTTTATLVCPANDNRRNCTCRNRGAEAVHYGDTTVTASNGATIEINESAQIEIRGAVYMIAEVSESTVSCTDERY